MASVRTDFEGDYDASALGYFDDNGTVSSSNFVCLAGYVSQKWGGEDDQIGFIEEWREMLREYKISTIGIHMKDLMPLQGKYKPLQWDYSKRDELLAKAIGLINKYTLAGYGIGVDAKHWRSLKQEERDYLGDPFRLCFERILRRVVESFRNIGMEANVPIIFDDNRKSAPTFYRRWSELREERPDLKRRIGAISFADDEIFYPLQAVDILAHQTGKDFQQKILGYDSTRQFKQLFFLNDLPTPVEYQSEFYDATALNNLLKDYRAAGI